MLFDDVLSSIGNTPLIRLNRLTEGMGSEVYVKVEGKNPAGSIKDRAALSMIEDAVARGVLEEGGTVIEPTSGNTGIGLCMVCAVRGYKAVIIMPDTMSKERISLMKAYGAEVILTPGKDGMAGAVSEAERIAEERGGIIAGQFDNPANPRAHVVGTAKEILNDLPDVDYVVAGIGTGGTATGIGEGFKLYSSNAKVVGVEPAESPLITEGRSGPHKIQGIGANFIPGNYLEEYIDRVVTVKGDDSIEMMRRLAREEGILAGISSGAAVFAALEIASKEEGKKIVAILPDVGDRYLSTGIFD
ncbi:MAG: cysteine synthase A [Methanomassiliicoccales archaeon]|uniref:cysteine synthase A n=2 Tax=Candidatus Methanarcanum hacksteinii TaxID=2911857 RepID=UPI0015A9C593|nr:cysteine synthase A [Candidatus Methanomethylophilaceae archaeon]MCI6025021.1 cysteine synthase A [Methanomassiliicoccales archaeon]MDD7479044.1 cysteine synthase A [Methanomassiliicoccales archaeon]